MTVVLKAPDTTRVPQRKITVFLAGSIDMGSAEDWQSRLTKDLQGHEDLVLFNPRRDDWDSSWVQDPSPGTQFHEQVTWELDRLDQSDIIAVYFADGSASPITLLELGLHIGSSELVIYCTPNFYRYGNVKIVADRHGLPVHSTYEDFLAVIKEKIGQIEDEMKDYTTFG